MPYVSTIWRVGGVAAEWRNMRVIDASHFEHAWTGDVLVAMFVRSESDIVRYTNKLLRAAPSVLLRVGRVGGRVARNRHRLLRRLHGGLVHRHASLRRQRRHALPEPRLAVLRLHRLHRLHRRHVLPLLRLRHHGVHHQHRRRHHPARVVHDLRPAQVDFALLLAHGAGVAADGEHPVVVAAAGAVLDAVVALQPAAQADVEAAGERARHRDERRREQAEEKHAGGVDGAADEAVQHARAAL